MWRNKRETDDFSAIRRDIYVNFKWIAATILFYNHHMKFFFIYWKADDVLTEKIKINVRYMDSNYQLQNR